MSLYKASSVEQVDSHTYRVLLQDPWAIGSVPHGGYVTTCVQQAVRKHFDTTLKKQGQPHTLGLHLSFLRRTSLGPAFIKIRDAKIGRQTSVVHITIEQDGREEVVGYITNTDLNAEKGLSYETAWDLSPKPPSVDLSALEKDSDRHWERRKRVPFPEFRKALRGVHLWYPKQGQFNPAIVDQWMALSSGENFTNESLGFVVDTFPQIIEHYVLTLELGTYNRELQRDYTFEEQMRRLKDFGGMWFPTVLLNMDVKKALPEGGVRFLFLRLQAKSIHNGRYDLEVIVKDAEGDLVALSHHIVMAVGAERNLASRRKTQNDGSTKL